MLNRHRIGLFLMPIFLGGALGMAQNAAPLPQMDFKRLMNNLQVTVASAPSLGDVATIGLVVRYGSAFDPAEKGGVAYLLSRMFLRATADKSLKDIQGELEYLGAKVEVSCDWDGFRFLLTGPVSKLERSLLLLYQIVGEARFEESDFAAIKQSLLEDLQKPPDPRKRIHDQLESALFSSTTYGRPMTGSPASVSAITLGDIRFFYRKFISPAEASLQIVGNVQAEPIFQRVARIWGVWVRNDEVPFTFSQPRNSAGRQIYLEDDPDSPAAQFIIGGLFPRREDADYVNALLASRVLQERLTKLLPTSLITVGSEGRRLASPFYVQGQAAADQAVTQIQTSQTAVEAMKAELISKEELEAARQQLILQFSRELGSGNGLCNMLLDAELYRLGSNYPTYFLDRIKRCDVQAIKQAANDWIYPGGEMILIRGPLVTLKPHLSLLGSFKQIVP
jgi:zinc protease